MSTPSSKRPRVDPTFPVAPYEQYQQPKLYNNILGSSGGTDRQYNLMLSYEKLAVSGTAHPLSVQWDLSLAPKPSDGRSHKAMWSISQMSVVQQSSNLFSADTSYQMCLDAPSPNSFSGMNFTTGDASPGKPSTLQRPNAFYNFFCTTAAPRFNLSEPNESITSFVGVYPVPTVTFSIRTDALPSAIITGTANEKFNVSLNLKVVLLD
tara:strand:+ start:420 stop:1043 length:624 start_codon:yes stop_codon:yes gene_type:complete